MGKAKASAPASIAILGGTFDPPHVGHVLAGTYVLLTAAVDVLFVIPCASHAFGKQATAFKHRLEMTRRAFAPLGEKAWVLDMEARREGPSYTVDTVRQIRREYPESRLRLVVGTDVMEELSAWKEKEALVEMAPPLVLPRMDEADARSGPLPAGQLLPPVSSTNIRQRLAAGEQPVEVVPHAVLAYIAENRIYI